MGKIPQHGLDRQALRRRPPQNSSAAYPQSSSTSSWVARPRGRRDQHRPRRDRGQFPPRRIFKLSRRRHLLGSPPAAIAFLFPRQSCRKELILKCRRSGAAPQTRGRQPRSRSLRRKTGSPFETLRSTSARIKAPFGPGRNPSCTGIISPPRDRPDAVSTSYISRRSGRSRPKSWRSRVAISSGSRRTGRRARAGGGLWA